MQLINPTRLIRTEYKEKQMLVKTNETNTNVDKIKKIYNYINNFIILIATVGLIKVEPHGQNLLL